jgi:2-keto-3-deoxy-6-phosphogluconate aldolase
VLSPADCARVADAGGRLMVAPNIDTDVMAMAQVRRMVTMPGVFSPSEALGAVGGVSDKWRTTWRRGSGRSDWAAASIGRA